MQELEKSCAFSRTKFDKKCQCQKHFSFDSVCQYLIMFLFLLPALFFVFFPHAGRILPGGQQKSKRCYYSGCPHQLCVHLGRSHLQKQSSERQRNAGRRSKSKQQTTSSTWTGGRAVCEPKRSVWSEFKGSREATQSILGPEERWGTGVKERMSNDA